MAATKIYIYGASGHGLVVADVARAVGYSEIIFLDDKSDIKFDPNLPKADIVIAVGDNKVRKNLQNKVEDYGFNVVSLIHPSAIVSTTTIIQKGVVVMPKVVINANSTIKAGAIINTAAVIEHECVIGEFAHISPAAVLAGGVRVGELSWVGINSCVKQCIKIGKNSIIGAGSVVVRDVLDCVVAYGNPAIVVRRI